MSDRPVSSETNRTPRTNPAPTADRRREHRTRRDVLRSVAGGTLGAGLAGVGAARGARAAPGSVASNASVEIATVEGLQAIDDDPTGDYHLAGDVDASGFDFEPIGSVEEPFTGTLRGNGNVVSDLTIDAGDSGYAGLFGAVGSNDVADGGRISNLLVGEASVNGGSTLGVLAGVNSGTIVDVSVGGEASGERQVGGLVGANEGCIFDARTDVDVTATGVAGGVAGTNRGYVTDSVASAGVSGESTVGGVAGTVSRGVVSRSTASGDVTGTVRVSTNIGGLVGKLGGKVLGSIAEGAVDGYDAVGGLVGYGSGGSIVVTSSATSSAPLVGSGDAAVVPKDHSSLGGNSRAAWWYQTYTGDRVSAAPTVVDGVVHVGTFDGMGNCEPDVYGIDAASGDEAWELDTEANGTRTAGPHRQNSYVRTSAANVVDGTAYVKVPGRGLLLAIDAATGDERWRGDMEREGHPGSPTRYGDTVFAKDGEWLYWFDAETGEVDQRRRVADPGVSTTDADGRVYAYDRNDGLRAWGAVSGDPLWTFGGLETPTRHAAATVAGGTVYAADRAGLLYAVDAATGEEQWQFEMRIDGSVDAPSCTPTVAAGTVFVGARSGRLYAVDAAAGEETWTYQPDSALPVRGAPTVVGDTVFFGSDDEHLSALDVASGETRWSFGATGAVRSPPTVVDGVVYFGTNGGFVYALDAGVDGSSEDSRVVQGTLGHHDAWAQQDDVPVRTATGGTQSSTATGDGQGPPESGTTDAPAGGGTGDGGANDGGDGTNGGDRSAGGDGESDGEDASVQVPGPGPGLAGAVGSVLGAGYLLNRRGRDGAGGDDPDRPSDEDARPADDARR